MRDGKIRTISWTDEHGEKSLEFSSCSSTTISHRILLTVWRHHLVCDLFLLYQLHAEDINARIAFYRKYHTSAPLTILRLINSRAALRLSM